MSRKMNRDDAIADLKVLKEYFEQEGGAYPISLEYAIEALENTHDIVRCKECKRFGDEGWCFWRDVAIKADDFCSYGERRE